MWQFHFPEARAETKTTLSSWNEWRQFEIEMLQKPKSSLLAFQLKTKNIASKADTLVMTAPLDYQKPQILSRLTTLNTKIKSLKLHSEI